MHILMMVRRLAWIGVAVAIIAAGLIFYMQSQGYRLAVPPAETGKDMPGQKPLGGLFTLTNHKRESISEKTFLGRPLLVFFGFTHCPDVCPTTLSETTRWLAELGKVGANIQVLFVSVDPDRDTPELLSTYLESFDPRIMAATGMKQQIDAMIAGFRAHYRFVPSGESYTVDHTALMFMMDSQGKFVGTIDYHEESGTALQKLRRLAIK